MSRLRSFAYFVAMSAVIGVLFVLLGLCLKVAYKLILFGWSLL